MVAHVGDYQREVAGPNNVNIRDALHYVSSFDKSDGAFTASNLVPELLGHMQRAFPLKVEHLGRPALNALIVEGRAAARQYGLTTPRAEALIVTLMFAFGHGCVAGPLYPWISRTLTDPKIIDRAERLEKKAMTWLDHVLARPSAVQPA